MRSRSLSSLFTWTLVLLSGASLALAQKGNHFPPPADPFADPKDDIDNPLRYIASNVLTAIAFSAFSQIARRILDFDDVHRSRVDRRSFANLSHMAHRRAIHALHGHRLLQYVPSLSAFPSLLTPPSPAFAVGLALRFGLHSNPDSKGIYITEYLFVVLSPCGFIAGEYVLLGRLSRWLRGDKHLWITPKRITTVFVTSDVVTFLIQVSRGSCMRVNP